MVATRVSAARFLPRLDRSTVVLTLVILGTFAHGQQSSVPDGAIGTPADRSLVLAQQLLAGGKANDAEALLQEAIRTHRDDARLWNLLGTARFKLKRYDAALEAFLAADALLPDQAPIAFNRGLCHFELHDYEQAEVLFVRATSLDGEHAQALVHLGRIALERGRADQAERHFQKAVAVGPHDPLTHYNLGLLLQKSDRLVDAARAFKTALEIDSAFASAHLNLGLVMRRLGDDAAASKHLERYEALNAAAIEAQRKALRLVSRLLAANEAIKAEKFDEALSLTNEARALDPSARAVYGLLAEILGRMGRRDEARKALAEYERLGGALKR